MTHPLGRGSGDLEPVPAGLELLVRVIAALNGDQLAAAAAPTAAGTETARTAAATAGRRPPDPLGHPNGFRVRVA
jgi:hypothetical protein